MILRGRTALVTGGAKRVGRAIALRLAAAGCDIALHYHRSRSGAQSTVRRCRGLGIRAALFAADLGDSAAPGRLIRSVLDRFQRLDILINNASTYEEMSLDQFHPDTWERTQRINLQAPVALVHAARAELDKRSGRIINLCDAAAGRALPNHLAYSAAKAGLAAVTSSLAVALAPRVNVVGIAPGVVAWPPNFDAALRQRILSRVPLRRTGTVADVASLVHAVLSEGDYLTGCIIPVDGGRSVV